MTRHTTFSPILVVTPSDQARQMVMTVLHQKLPDFKSDLVQWLTEPDQIPSIEQLRELIYRFSYGLGAEEYAVCVIPQLNHAPAESSHTLLKTLEEPPDRTLILLTVDSTHHLLPTLLSRCQIYHPSIDQTVESNSKIAAAEQLAKSLTGPSIYQVWSLLPKTITQVQALELLQHLTQVVLPQRLTVTGRQMLRQILTAISQLQANTHVRLTVENCLLQMYVLAKGTKTATKKPSA